MGTMGRGEVERRDQKVHPLISCLGQGRSQSQVPFRLKEGSKGYTNGPTTGSQSPEQTHTRGVSIPL